MSTTKHHHWLQSQIKLQKGDPQMLDLAMRTQDQCTILSNARVTLSPPNTCTESEEKSETDEDSGETRLLFTVILDIPSGTIQHCKVNSEAVQPQLLNPGCSFFSLVDGKAKSLVLTAASTSTKQRIFCRINCGYMSNACELLCKFEEETARVTALALRPAFGPSTPFHPITFTTRHSTSCAITHIDYTSIPYLGHLPTDVLGKSILSLVYAADMNVVRQAHIDLYNSRGKVVKSVAPLRLVAYNGAVLTAHTEWSAYVNPWTKCIEMVVARHRIVDAPVGAANVLAAPLPGTTINVLPAGILKGFDETLKQLMNKPVPSRSGAVGLGPSGHRISDVESYIGRIVESLVVNSNTGINETKSISLPCKEEVVESPTDLPLSYNQINCLENVRRLLHSQVRSESPMKSDAHDHRLPKQAVRLTRESLMQHTKRLDDEYRDTWTRRLKRMSSELLPGAPLAKQARPSTSSTPPIHWTTGQREEYYRSLAPNPPPPPGKNFQITTVPLPPADTCTPSSGFSSAPDRISAFTAVQRKAMESKDYAALLMLARFLPGATTPEELQNTVTQSRLVFAPRNPASCLPTPSPTQQISVNEQPLNETTSSS